MISLLVHVKSAGDGRIRGDSLTKFGAAAFSEVLGPDMIIRRVRESLVEPGTTDTGLVNPRALRPLWRVPRKWAPGPAVGGAAG